MEKQTTPVPSACLGDKDDTGQEAHASAASLPAARDTAANVHPKPRFQKRRCNDSMISWLIVHQGKRAGGHAVPSKGVIRGGVPKGHRPSRIWDTHEPDSMCPQLVPLQMGDRGAQGATLGLEPVFLETKKLGQPAVPTRSPSHRTGKQGHAAKLPPLLRPSLQLPNLRSCFFKLQPFFLP